MKNLMILILALVTIAAFCDAQAPPIPNVQQLNEFSNLFFSWINGLVAGATGMTTGE